MATVDHAPRSRCRALPGNQGRLACCGGATRTPLTPCPQGRRRPPRGTTSSRNVRWAEKARRIGQATSACGSQIRRRLFTRQWWSAAVSIPAMNAVTRSSWSSCRCVAEPLDRLRQRKGLAIWPGRGHGAESVSTARMRPMTGTLALQAVEIDLAVPTLVVVANAGATSRHWDVADDRVTERDVLLNIANSSLVSVTASAGRRPGCRSSRCRGAGRRAGSCAASPRRDPCARQEDAVAGDVFRVSLRVSVLRVDGDDEPLEHSKEPLTTRPPLRRRATRRCRRRWPWPLRRDWLQTRIVTDAACSGYAATPALTLIGRRSESPNWTDSASRPARSRSTAATTSSVPAPGRTMRYSSGP